LTNNYTRIIAGWATTTDDDGRRRTTTDDDGRRRTTTDDDGRRMLRLGRARRLGTRYWRDSRRLSYFVPAGKRFLWILWTVRKPLSLLLLVVVTVSTPSSYSQ
jgi:hypothetical protein